MVALTAEPMVALTVAAMAAMVVMAVMAAHPPLPPIHHQKHLRMCLLRQVLILVEAAMATPLAEAEQARAPGPVMIRLKFRQMIRLNLYHHQTSVS